MAQIGGRFPGEAESLGDVMGVQQRLDDSHGGETLGVGPAVAVMRQDVRRGAEDHRPEHRARGFEDLEETGGPGLAVGRDRIGRAALAVGLPHERDLGVLRRFRGSQLRGVGEQVVAEVLDRLPAVPLQRARLDAPVGVERCAQRRRRQVYGLFDIGGRDR
jgi:hypothetical protein